MKNEIEDTKKTNEKEDSNQARCIIQIGQLVEFMGGWFRIHSVNGKRNRVTLKAVSRKETEK